MSICVFACACVCVCVSVYALGVRLCERVFVYWCVRLLLCVCVTDRPSSPALSQGAAAGIAVAVTLVVVALVVGLYCGLTYHL